MNGISPEEYKAILNRSKKEDYSPANRDTPPLYKIIIYLVPLTPIYFYITKTFSGDKTFFWNVKQSIILQSIYYLTFFIISFTNFYSFSTYLRDFILIVGFMIQFLCAIASYNDSRIKLPLISKYFKDFLENN